MTTMREAKEKKRIRNQANFYGKRNKSCEAIFQGLQRSQAFLVTDRTVMSISAVTS